MKGRIQQRLLSPAAVWVCPQRWYDTKDCSWPPSVSLWSCTLGYCRRQLSFSSFWIRTFRLLARDIDRLFSGAQQRFAAPASGRGIDNSASPVAYPVAPLRGCPCDVLGTPLPAMSTDRPKAAMGLGVGGRLAIAPPTRRAPAGDTTSISMYRKRYVLRRNRESQYRPVNAISQELTSLPNSHLIILSKPGQE